MVDLWANARSQSAMNALGGRGPTPLPCPGGWQDQPAALMDAFTLLDGMVEGEGS